MLVKRWARKKTSFIVEILKYEPIAMKKLRKKEHSFETKNKLQE